MFQSKVNEEQICKALYKIIGDKKQLVQLINAITRIN